MNDLVRRSITGAGIVLFLLAGFLLHPVSFYLTGLILLSASMYEYYRIVVTSGIKPMAWPGIVTGMMLYTVSTCIAAGICDFKFILLMIPVFTSFVIAELFRKQEKPFDSLAHTVFPVIWIAIPFSLFPFAAFSQEGISTILTHRYLFSPGVVVGFFLLIWSNDTGAYLAGITMGRHRLLERISPKKTWEGFLGGLLFSLAVAWLISGMLNQNNLFMWLLISIVVSIFGTLGDLAESMLKRSTGIKDSGSIMPGHGGFLDRFDSAILSFPLVYVLLVVFG